MIEDLHGPKRALSKPARLDGAYLRFTGQVKVRRFRSGVLAQEHADDGIWELMYFGHARGPSDRAGRTRGSYAVAGAEVTRGSRKAQGDGHLGEGLASPLGDVVERPDAGEVGVVEHLPVTTVKVDRSFVERLGSPDDSTAVVKAIVEMSHAMGLSTVAEGVSSARLQALVSGLGCELARGFYWARPMPAVEHAAWWRGAERLAAALRPSGN